jgi:modulator of FtsH protease HflK
MAQLSIAQLPSAGAASRSGLFSVVGLIALVALLFFIYLVSPFFTVGEYERTVVTRFGQFSSVAGPGLHFRTPFVNGLETYPIGIRRLQKDHLNTYTVDNQELVTLSASTRMRFGASLQPTATFVRTLNRS